MQGGLLNSSNPWRWVTLIEVMVAMVVPAIAILGLKSLLDAEGVRTQSSCVSDAIYYPDSPLSKR